MIAHIGDNIITSLGFTTRENYQALKAGQTGITPHEATEPYQASFIDKDALRQAFARRCKDGAYTILEKALILSVATAAAEAQIDPASPHTIFILSTTKGNIHLLDQPNGSYPPHALLLHHTARQLSQYFGNANRPIVISNACISGLSAQITAMRELKHGYKHAIVAGIDLLSRFILTGFQSLKALSPHPCRPFDVNRTGLNLGEAAATIIYKKPEPSDPPPIIHLSSGAIRNDANHISGPSRTAEGSYNALKAILPAVDTSRIAFISAHGTATPYNDRMEAIAIHRAGLSHIPVNSLKPYFGHTLGAAGILESIISTHALADNTILPTPGHQTGETEYPLLIPTSHTATDKTAYIKIMSGFGGCNAALLFIKPQPSNNK